MVAVAVGGQPLNTRNTDKLLPLRVVAPKKKPLLSPPPIGRKMRRRRRKRREHRKRYFCAPEVRVMGVQNGELSANPRKQIPMTPNKDTDHDIYSVQ